MGETLLHRLTELEELSPETFLLHFERNNFLFQTGQYVVLRNPADGEGREYSIYSGEHSDRLSVLVREIPGGRFTSFLKKQLPGALLQIEGPRGFFILDEAVKRGHPVLFIATGTGISPFHSMVTTYPGLNYRLLHGVRLVRDAYGRSSFCQTAHVLCTSRDDGGNFHGRVTDYLHRFPVEATTICYLCGNAEMIEEATTILDSCHVAPENIRTEVFF